MLGQEDVLTPGAAIQQHLDSRGWNQADLAHILGVQQSVISTLVTGKRPISLEIARDLSVAFRTDLDYWLKLETDFRLFNSDPTDTAIDRRARLFEAAPVNEMIRRRWIQLTDDIDLLEKQILGFYGVAKLEDIAQKVPHAARKSTSYNVVKPAERAWMQRVRSVAQMVSANKFSDNALERTLTELRGLTKHAESIRYVPKLLAEAGVRLVIVEPLPRTRIEGVCVWLDKKAPVVGLSLRIDRIDSFWFTLLHEIWHVKNRDGLLTPAIVDSDLTGETAVSSDKKPESERRADLFAQESLVGRGELDNFIARVDPLFSRARVEGFAARIGISPAIIFGQLHHRGKIPWDQHSREFNIKIREIITQSALVDGWGQTLPAFG
jgi:HTH-type transcriptional regulator / antitoxin HigA